RLRSASSTASPRPTSRRGSCLATRTCTSPAAAAVTSGRRGWTTKTCGCLSWRKCSPPPNRADASLGNGGGAQSGRFGGGGCRAAHAVRPGLRGGGPLGHVHPAARVKAEPQRDGPHGHEDQQRPPYKRKGKPGRQPARGDDAREDGRAEQHGVAQVKGVRRAD